MTVANESHYVSESGLINKNCYLGFDELTHFTESQFFYMLSRNRSTCGIRPYVRATCNPEPGWVADFLAWWIDQSTGLAIPERSGVVRYFIRGNDEKIYWGDTKEEIIEEFPEYSPEDILSVTFILATLDDNKILQKKDPGYKARLMSLSKIERDRLLGGNWKVAEGAQINGEWIRKYSTNAVEIECVFQDMLLKLPMAMMRRIATIDTAGTSKEKAAKDRGKEPSWSVCGVWDIVTRMSVNYQGRAVQLSEMIFLRYVWRKQVDWNGLRQGIDETLDTWNVTKAYIENAHFGQALKQEIKSCPCELIGPVLPGMGDRGEGAKLERAIASGMLSRFEHGKIFVPREPSDWLAAYLREIEAWTGKPDEVADQIDMTSYASYLSKKGASAWGGVIQTNQGMMR
ncbi:terminase large subunit domain-containing protein [Pirellula sp. SH-Sr6A]|uniref:terminase large subunit domain-containing protein n=1 Tax=Pirellula sp. SH-Sr6A TaxID=1632865 RepID=UPI001F0A5CCC|nr:terminase family protein [Pirellula sp. SH-Sr6A]